MAILFDCLAPEKDKPGPGDDRPFETGAVPGGSATGVLSHDRTRRRGWALTRARQGAIDPPSAPCPDGRGRPGAATTGYRPAIEQFAHPATRRREHRSIRMPDRTLIKLNENTCGFSRPQKSVISGVRTKPPVSLPQDESDNSESIYAAIATLRLTVRNLK